MSPRAERINSMKDMAECAYGLNISGQFDAASDVLLTLVGALVSELLALSVEEAGGEWQGTR